MPTIMAMSPLSSTTSTTNRKEMYRITLSALGKRTDHNHGALLVKNECMELHTTTLQCMHTHTPEATGCSVVVPHTAILHHAPDACEEHLMEEPARAAQGGKQ